MNSAPRLPDQFDFGENWEDFSRNALDPEKVQQAKEDFQRLLNGIPLDNRSFLDIGFGQGLSLLSAASGGARCLGIDINVRCLQVLSQNRKAFFPEVPDEQIALAGFDPRPGIDPQTPIGLPRQRGKVRYRSLLGSSSPYRINVPSDPKLGRSGFRARLPGAGHLSDSLVECAMEMHQISLQ
jgi:hypothetical protein